MKMIDMTYLPAVIAVVLALFLTAPNLTAQQISPEDETRAMEYYIRGLSAFENEEYQQALDLLNIAYLTLPESPGVNYAMADTYLELYDFENAVQYAQFAVDLDPSIKWYHLKLAEIHQANRQPQKAIEALRRARSYHPNDFDILYQKAALYSNLREFEKSNEVLAAILDFRAGDSQIHQHRFQNFSHLDELDSAAEELRALLKLQPDDPGTMRTLSQIYLEQEKPDEALNILNEARRINPRDAETLILLAGVYIEKEEWEELGSTFVSLIEDPLLSAQQKMEIARYIYLRHQSEPDNRILGDQTRRVLTHFSKSEPDFGDAHLLAAEFYLNHNQTEEAISKLESANRASPADAEPWRQRLQLLFSKEAYNEVIQVGEQASEHIREDAYIYFFTGASFMLTDQYEEAADWLEQASYMPSNRNFRSVIHGALGDVLTEQDRWEEAVESYETALRLNSSNHNAMNNFAYYLSLRSERLDYARELALQAIEYEPDNAAYLDTVGWVYFKLEDYESAKKYIRSSIETGDASAEVYEHMGDVYEKLDRLEDAAIWWEKAFEKDPDRTHLKEKLDTP